MINPEPQPMAGRITKKTEMAGVRRLSRLTGIVIFLGSLGAFPIGTAIGILIMISLFIIGNRIATKYYCSSCGSLVDNTKVKMCPVCKISLKWIAISSPSGDLITNGGLETGSLQIKPYGPTICLISHLSHRGKVEIKQDNKLLYQFLRQFLQHNYNLKLASIYGNK